MTDVEIIKEQKIEADSVFMRTIVKKTVYERLKIHAQRYSTGRGNWDFGVAIELLLDWYEESKVSQLTEKIDLILNAMSNPQQEELPEEKFEEFLGGHKEKVE